MPDTPTPKDLAEAAEQLNASTADDQSSDDQQTSQTAAADQDATSEQDTGETTNGEDSSSASSSAADDDQDSTDDQSADTDDGSDEDGQTDWKAHARKHEQRAKSNLQRFKDEQKRSEQLQAELTELKAQQVRHDVAAETGVPAHLLKGDTKEELAEYAEALLTFAGKQKTGPVVPEAGTGDNGANIDDEAQKALKALGFDS